MLLMAACCCDEANPELCPDCPAVESVTITFSGVTMASPDCCNALPGLLSVRCSADINKVGGVTVPTQNTLTDCSWHDATTVSTGSVYQHQSPQSSPCTSALHPLDLVAISLSKSGTEFTLTVNAILAAGSFQERAPIFYDVRTGTADCSANINFTNDNLLCQIFGGRPTAGWGGTATVVFNT